MMHGWWTTRWDIKEVAILSSLTLPPHFGRWKSNCDASVFVIITRRMCCVYDCVCLVAGGAGEGGCVREIVSLNCDWSWLWNVRLDQTEYIWLCFASKSINTTYQPVSYRTYHKNEVHNKFTCTCCICFNVLVSSTDPPLARRSNLICAHRFIECLSAVTFNSYVRTCCTYKEQVEGRSRHVQ